MHELFSQVLSRRDLSRAGDLFSVPDSDIVHDLSAALYCIQEIASSENYVRSDNDQAVVEICITRVTTAIRDTGSIEEHVEALVSLWQSCLHHNLKLTTRDEDPPHAKIASDIMSCLFMQNYGKRSVMELALPVAIRFLRHGNRDLIRNVSSYLALAAIENAHLLAEHCRAIIHSITQGNRSLTRILPQIYTEDPGPIEDCLPDLVSILPGCDENEKSNILQLMALMAKRKPKILKDYVPVLVANLNNPTTSQTVLSALVDIASIDPAPFTLCLAQLQAGIRRQPALLSMAGKIFGAVGRLSPEAGEACIEFLVQELSCVDQTALPAILIEIKSIGDRHKGILGPYIQEISMQSQSNSTAARMIVQQLQRDTVSSEHGLHRPVSMIEPRHLSQDNKPFSATNISQMSEERKKLYRKAQGRPHTRSDMQGSLQPLRHPGHSYSEQALHLHHTPLGVGRVNSNSLGVLEMAGRSESKGSVQSGASGTALRSGTRKQITTSPTRKSEFERKITNRQHRSSKGNLNLHVSLATSSENESATSPTSPPTSAQTHMEANGNSTSTHASSLQGRVSPSSPTLQSPTSQTSSGIGDGSRLSVGMSMTGSGSNRDSSLQQYLFKRQREMSSYMDSIKDRIPIPEECTVQEDIRNRPVGKLDFYCSLKEPHCLYSTLPFSMETKQILPWIHLKYLHLQATSPTPVSLDDNAVQSLKMSWEKQKTIGGHMTFLKLITQNFPQAKVQQGLIRQLCRASYYDMFTYNAKTCNWTCFLCSSPNKMDKMMDLMGTDSIPFQINTEDLIAGGQPLIEGQLKEKKVRWKLFRRWKTRYFTLAGERLLYSKNKSQMTGTLPIELSKVQSVKTLRRRDRSIPKAFEIFTDDQKTYVFKTRDGANAEQWVQCLTLAMRQRQASFRSDNESTT
ncbi:LOW QUALITY PROTEIN: ventricular zone-expressed PH domain-containing protein homolog 1-like [Lytechinus variegatus]|uniref:LOW QUALITY PROTEIN: ventricular zone-expressed PH domain-containing protein homolog 1-like n=1 Tax=Lytechinus variegatus TaxID=7654 RepID=UPI001BB266CC|nr:LOW QUALITY PROTEIN: ventricular zone-expressed PH domain-containing protein homolog 1-like [Lytechinus variegatus]